MGFVKIYEPLNRREKVMKREGLCFTEQTHSFEARTCFCNFSHGRAARTFPDTRYDIRASFELGNNR